jgi:HD-GYP domain-containing protein (c-di-GMP phosphodiesterase class II)
LQIVGLGGFLHDIGMTQLPRAICDSVNPLNEEEWKEMKSHPGLGLRMLEGAHSISDGVRYIVYQHHEQPSGQGYPNGLRDNAIYLPAKVISLADSFSALISKRPFREAFSVEDAIGVLERETGKFDPNLVGILKTIFLTKYNKKAA